MLDVQRRPNVDPRLQQLLDVLPPLGMARARRIGVGVFVDQQEVGFAGQRRVEVELGARAAFVIELLPRQDFQLAQQRLGLAPPVRFDDPDNDVEAFRLAAPGLAQHVERLADAWRHAEEDLEPSPACPADLVKEGLRVRSARLVLGHLAGRWLTG